MDREAWRVAVHGGRKEPDMTEQRSELKEERADKTKNAGMEKPDLYYPSFPSLIL